MTSEVSLTLLKASCSGPGQHCSCCSNLSFGFKVKSCYAAQSTHGGTDNKALVCLCMTEIECASSALKYAEARRAPCMMYMHGQRIVG